MSALTRGEESAFVLTPKGKEWNNAFVRTLEKSKTFFRDKAHERARMMKPEDLVQSLIKERPRAFSSTRFPIVRKAQLRESAGVRSVARRIASMVTPVCGKGGG